MKTFGIRTLRSGVLVEEKRVMNRVKSFRKEFG